VRDNVKEGLETAKVSARTGLTHRQKNIVSYKTEAHMDRSEIVPFMEKGKQFGHQFV
jgi:hypothetical protein